MDMSQRDRRSSRRVPSSWHARVRTGELGVAAVDVRDVSSNGVQLTVPVHLVRGDSLFVSQVHAGAPVSLTLLSGDEPVHTALARTRWHRAGEDGSLDVGMALDVPLPHETIEHVAQLN